MIVIINNFLHRPNPLSADIKLNTSSVVGPCCVLLTTLFVDVLDY
jgi:hypothetical protein